MMKVIPSSLSRVSLDYLRKPFASTSKYFFSSIATTKVNSQLHNINIKGLKPADTEKAVKLIFSERRYADFTEEERRIVNLYQDKMLEVDGGVILPNTRADLEQREIEQLLRDARYNS
ncbi:MAG: hypothetical protein HYZ47_01665 [Simkania negevensis]|nr:hypothetical protein [Simkania negevensis]